MGHQSGVPPPSNYKTLPFRGPVSKGNQSVEIAHQTL